MMHWTGIVAAAAPIIVAPLFMAGITWPTVTPIAFALLAVQVLFAALYGLWGKNQ